MALITQKRVQGTRHLPAKLIPVAATHVVWYVWGGTSASAGKVVVQYADTQRSAAIAYGKASRLIGTVFPWGEVIEAGWAEIEPADRVNGKAI